MQGTQPVQVQIETQGAVPEGMPELAIAKVDSVLRLATEPVLQVRVTLTMAADPAVALPAVARVNVDLDGRLVRAQAAGETMRESVEHMASRLRVRLERSARNWEARRGDRPADAPGEWRHQSIPAHHPSYFPRPAEGRQVIRRRSYAAGRKTPEEALADLNLLDYDFYLFTDELTGQDSAIYRVADGYRLAQACGSAASAAPRGNGTDQAARTQAHGLRRHRAPGGPGTRVPVLRRYRYQPRQPHLPPLRRPLRPRRPGRCAAMNHRPPGRPVLGAR